MNEYSNGCGIDPSPFDCVASEKSPWRCGVNGEHRSTYNVVYCSVSTFTKKEMYFTKYMCDLLFVAMGGTGKDHQQQNRKTPFYFLPRSVTRNHWRHSGFDAPQHDFEIFADEPDWCESKTIILSIEAKPIHFPQKQEQQLFEHVHSNRP